MIYLGDKGSVKVAEEAARLLYYSVVEDYRSAKEAARSSLGMSALPSNFEVAIQLDRLADTVEGESRRELLVNMRRQALQIMDKLEPFGTRLIGSVWRGTARRGSDIDITVYSEKPEAVVSMLRKEYGSVRAEYASKTSEGVTERYLHIYLNSPEYEVEIVVRSPEEMDERRICETYGDQIVGLTRTQLRELLEKNPIRRFLPRREPGFE